MEKKLLGVIIVLLITITSLIATSNTYEKEIILVNEFKLLPITYDEAPVFYGEENTGRTDCYFVYIKNNTKIEKTLLPKYKTSILENATKPILKKYSIKPIPKNKIYDFFFIHQETTRYEIVV
ncbi:MAG: hypothetical protein WC157_03550 [Candidatus Paceibacterota bacterium]